MYCSDDCNLPIKRRFVDGIEILDEVILYRNGSFIRVKQWLRGIHPELGVLVLGWTGWETVVEKDVIRPSNTFYVVTVCDHSLVKDTPGGES